MKQRNFIDLFSGAGGFSLGFERAGFTNLFAVEIQKEYCQTYKANFANHTLLEEDIASISKEKIKELLGEVDVDVIIGGPPCQGFSIAGNIGRKFIDDPRNRLFLEFVRFVSIVQPKAFVMENVARLYTHNKSKTREEIIESFNKLGYKVECKILNSADYGVPQVRKRVIFIGSKVGDAILFPEVTHKEHKTLKQALQNLPTLQSGEASHLLNHKAMKHSKQMLLKMSYLKDGEGREKIPPNLRPKSGDVRKYIKYNSSKPSITITGDMRKVFHPFENRALTVRELARLQSFPDDFEFKSTTMAQQQQVGNAVPPLMAQAIANAITKMLE